MQTRDKVNAIIGIDAAFCGYCGHKLFVIEKVPTKDNAIVEIKCKHKDSGKTCNTINIVNLQQ